MLLPKRQKTLSDRLSKKFNIFIIISTISLILDQSTKYWIRNSETINNGGWKIIPGFFDLVHRENPGAAFGLLSNLPEMWRLTIFLGMTLVALFVCLDMYRRLPKSDVFMSSTLALVLSGAIGNAIDRIHQTTVTDFLRFYTDHPPVRDWLQNHWPYMAEYPSFNVADSALVVGIGMFLFHYLFLEEKEQAALAEADASASDETRPEEDDKQSSESV